MGDEGEFGADARRAVLSMMFRSTFSRKGSLAESNAPPQWLAVLFFLCGQLFSPRSGVAAQTVAERASELLHQQIEEWKTPFPTPETTTAPQETKVLSATPDATSPTDASAPSTATTPPSPLGAQPIIPPKAPSGKLMAGKDILRSAVMLARFYEGRAYQLAWSDNDGPVSQADDLLNTIQVEAAHEGLQVGNYHLEKLQTLPNNCVRTPPCSSIHVPLQILTCSLYGYISTYGAQVALRKTNLKGLNAEWFAKEQRTGFSGGAATSNHNEAHCRWAEILTSLTSRICKAARSTRQHRDPGRVVDGPLFPQASICTQAVTMSVYPRYVNDYE